MVRAKTGGFGGVPLGFATDAPRGSAGSFTKISAIDKSRIEILESDSDWRITATTPDACTNQYH